MQNPENVTESSMLLSGNISDVESSTAIHEQVTSTFTPSQRNMTGVQRHCQKTSAPHWTLQKEPSEKAIDSEEEPFSSTEVGKGSSALDTSAGEYDTMERRVKVFDDWFRPLSTVWQRHDVRLLPRKWRRLSHPNHRNHGQLHVQGHNGERNAAIWKISDGSWVVVPTGQQSETLFPLCQGLVRTALSERYDLAKPISRPESLRASLEGPWYTFEKQNGQKLYREVGATQGRMDQDPTSDPNELDRVHAKKM
uniref:Uncharacterized protein n=2 Tax=Caenorhabditis japonica TaxID=281687 RepID=A0A8R1EAA6_CAEJA